MTRRLLLIFFVLTFAATAGTITYDWQTDLIRTPDVPTVGPFLTDWSSLLSFPLWNPALFPGQKLDSVQFTIWGRGTGSIELSNSGPSEATVQGSNNIEVTLNLPGGLMIIALPSFSTGEQTIQPGPPVMFGPYVVEDSDTSDEITTNLGVYQGSGFLDLNVTGNNTFVISGGGAGDGDIINSQASAWGSVTYNYSAAGVPEPAMLTLVGGGLLGLGFFARRRKTA